MSEPAMLVGLLLWGTIVGVDAVSFPQVLLNRPLVAAGLAGLLVGDLATALRVGVVLELFALDTMPIGAARYPDFGPAAVAAVAAVAWARGPAGELALGPAVIGALLLAVVGGRAMEILRRVNGLRLHAAEARLAAGDTALVGRLHRLGLLGDALRSLLITSLGLLGALLLSRGAVPQELARTLTALAIGGALVAALAGTLRRAGTAGGASRIGLLAGLLGGGALAWLL